MPESVNPLSGEPPTGEPYAGEPHVRFGGRRSRVFNRLFLPLSNLGSSGAGTHHAHNHPNTHTHNDPNTHAHNHPNAHTHNYPDTYDSSALSQLRIWVILPSCC